MSNQFVSEFARKPAASPPPGQSTIPLAHASQRWMHVEPMHRRRSRTSPDTSVKLVSEIAKAAFPNRDGATRFERDAEASESGLPNVEQTPNLQAARIHSNEHSARFAGLFRARAVTVGRDIYFGQSEFRPGDSAGRSLIRHELAHVGQDRPANAAHRSGTDGFEFFAASWGGYPKLVDAIRYGTLQPCDLSALSEPEVRMMYGALLDILGVMQLPDLNGSGLQRSVAVMQDWLDGGWQRCMDYEEVPEPEIGETVDPLISDMPEFNEAEALLQVPPKQRKAFLDEFSNEDLEHVTGELQMIAQSRSGSEYLDIVGAAQAVQKARAKSITQPEARAAAGITRSPDEELVLAISPQVSSAMHAVRATTTATELEKAMDKLEKALASVKVPAAQKSYVKIDAKALAIKTFAEEELRQIGTTPKKWFARVRNQTFLGHRIKANTGAKLDGVHPELGDPLHNVEKSLMKEFGGSAEVVGRHLGISAIFGMRGVSGEDRPSMHTYALAIDIDPATNPRIRKGPEEEAIKRAKQAQSGTVAEYGLIHKGKGKTPIEDIFLEHTKASEELRFYFGLLDSFDSAGEPLDAQSAMISEVAKNLGIEPGELKQQIEDDMKAFKGKDGEFAQQIRSGEKDIDNLHVRMVDTMEAAGLYWGARMAEPDIHHFDARTTGSFAGRRK
jgi:hypothetical protein